jgi:FkbM family methyltransferase
MIVGRTDRCIVSRGGIAYDLDLSQGIDFAIYLGDIFERSTRQALRRLVKPSTVVLDIGANIGAHTLYLARLVGPQGRVLAFEPTDFAFQKQARNFKLNPDLAKRITAHQYFLASQDEAVIPDGIYSSWPLIKGANRHAKHSGQEMPTEAARVRSLDSVLADHIGLKVDLVKLDVDGHECEILRGAGALLKYGRPTFLVELAPYALREHGSSLSELLSFFVPNGYRLFDERTFRPLPLAAAALEDMIADGESMNVIAQADSSCSVSGTDFRSP